MSAFYTTNDYKSFRKIFEILSKCFIIVTIRFIRDTVEISSRHGKHKFVFVTLTNPEFVHPDELILFMNPKNFFYECLKDIKKIDKFTMTFDPHDKGYLKLEYWKTCGNYPWKKAEYLLNLELRQKAWNSCSLPKEIEVTTNSDTFHELIKSFGGVHNVFDIFRDKNDILVGCQSMEKGKGNGNGVIGKGTFLDNEVEYIQKYTYGSFYSRDFNALDKIIKHSKNVTITLSRDNDIKPYPVSLSYDVGNVGTVVFMIGAIDTTFFDDKDNNITEQVYH
ncbi:MAG: hypothetical protein N2B06_04820 [Clostridium sp.]